MKRIRRDLSPLVQKKFCETECGYCWDISMTLRHFIIPELADLIMEYGFEVDMYVDPCQMVEHVYLRYYWHYERCYRMPRVKKIPVNIVLPPMRFRLIVWHEVKDYRHTWLKNNSIVMNTCFQDNADWTRELLTGGHLMSFGDFLIESVWVNGEVESLAISKIFISL